MPALEYGWFLNDSDGMFCDIVFIYFVVKSLNIFQLLS